MGSLLSHFISKNDNGLMSSLTFKVVIFLLILVYYKRVILVKMK